MRIALHVPRASYLAPGTSGDPIFLHALVAKLRARDHRSSPARTFATTGADSDRRASSSPSSSR
jgi:hypothetical protein